MNDCKWIVNIDECSLNHCTCNGCMACKNYEPKPELSDGYWEYLKAQYERR